MPILNEETEERVAGDVTAATMGVIAAMLIGKELRPDAINRGRLFLPRLGRTLTPLERAYLAGKVANVVGPAKVRKMTAATLDKWIATRIKFDEQDLARLEGLKGRTRRWLRGRQEDWAKRNRVSSLSLSRGPSSPLCPALLSLPALLEASGTLEVN